MGDGRNRKRERRDREEVSVKAGGLRTVAALLLAAVLLAAGGTVWAFFHPDSVLCTLLPFLHPSPGEDWSRTVAYVPLDDRTDNLEDVELLAEASGWRILLPPRDWFRTALDGQPRNANGTGHGRREALLEWVRDLDKAGCDRFILSLDQLFSGGLVHSRTVGASWPLTFSDGTTLNETEAFRDYILPLAEDPENRVYLFDSVLRLSPTVSYAGVTSEEYYALREYGMAERPRADTLKELFAQYPYAADGVTAVEEEINGRFRPRLTEGLLDWYLSVRRRKLAMTDSFLTALHSLDGADNVYLLIGIDDSSNRPNIQYNELRYLERRLAETGLTTAGTVRIMGTNKDIPLTDTKPVTETKPVTNADSLTKAEPSASRARLMAGLDSLARLLLCRMAWEEYGRPPVRASVRYVGGTEEQHSSEFDLYTLEEVAELHLDLFGAERVPERNAELQFVVMTAPEEPSEAETFREELLSLLEENVRRHIPTVLDEASNNAYGDELEQALLERIPFASLAGFAGKYDQANVTGAAFAMGFSRYLYLKYGQAVPERETNWWTTLTGNFRTDSDRQMNPERQTDAERRTDSETDAETDPKTRADLAHLRQLANSMALTEYILHVRAPLNAYLAERGLDWNNMKYTPLHGQSGVLQALEELFRPDLEWVCENLRGTGLLTGVEAWQEREIGDVSITDLYFPWNRTFEVAFTVEARFADDESGVSGDGQREP